MQAWRQSLVSGTRPSLLDRWNALRAVLIRQQFLSNVGLLTLANSVSAALSFVQGMLVAHWLGPKQYGTAALIMSYPTLLFTVLDARSNMVTTKFLSEFNEKGEAQKAAAICQLGYGVDFTIAVATFFLVTSTAWWAEARIVHSPGVTPLIILFALAFAPRALASTSRVTLSVLGHFATLAWVEVLTTALRVVAVLGLVIGQGEIAGVIWGNVVGMFTSGILLAAVAYKPRKDAWGSSSLLASWETLRGRRREILHYLLWTNFAELIGLVVKQLDLVMLGYFRGQQEAGYYKLAKSLAALVGHVAGPLESVTYPRLAALTSACREAELRQVVRMLALCLGLPIGGVSCIGFWLVPWLLSWLADASFVSATRPAQLLLACSVMWLTCFWLRPLYFAQGAVRSWTIISSSIGGASLVGLPFCAYWWGGIGLAAWQLGAMLFSYGLFVLLAVRHFHTTPAPTKGSTNAYALLR